MELIILQSLNNFSKFEKILSRSADILVFDQSVMIELDQKGIKYKSVEDFYTPDDYSKDIYAFRNKVEDLLMHLDKEQATIVNFPYSYNGNGHYFYKWFDNLFYLEKLIQVLKKKYNKIYLFAPNEPKKLKNDIFKFSNLNSKKVDGTISFTSETSAERVLQLIYNSLDIYFLEDRKVPTKKIPVKYKVKYLFNRLKIFYDRKQYSKNFFFNRYLNKIEKKIFLIQDSYEVTLLKKYLVKSNFLNPTIKLRKNIALEQPVVLKNSNIENILLKFANKELIFLREYFCILLNSYSKEVVGRISSYKKKFELLVKKDKPNLFLLGVGTRDVFDMICCYIANTHDIPVILLQHGISRILVDAPNAKSVEYNSQILKTLIVQSKKDVDYLQNSKTEVFCMGSINQYERNNICYNHKPTKEILFCLGPDSNFVFRHLLDIYSINKKHQQSTEVITTAEECSLSIDIKLHPLEDQNSLKNYLDIIKNNKFKQTKIIYGGSAENLSRSYKLVIIDFLSSSIRNHILSLDIPVIIYDRDFDKIKFRKDALSSLYDRCYIAKNTSDLRKFLNNFKLGKLPSKWSKDIIDKYIYPIDKGNPGKNIAEYIEGIVLK
mgnify:CR=1 FL=1